MALKPIQFDPGTAGRTARSVLFGIVAQHRLRDHLAHHPDAHRRRPRGHPGEARGQRARRPRHPGGHRLGLLQSAHRADRRCSRSACRTWCGPASAHEGRTVDESITFSSQEGVNINADIGLSFHIEPSLAPHLYLRFRQPDLMLLADGYVRNAVREAFNDVASHMAVQEIYGSGKGKLVADVTGASATCSARTASSSISSPSTARCACPRTWRRPSTAPWRRRRTPSRPKTACAR